MPPVSPPSRGQVGLFLLTLSLAWLLPACDREAPPAPVAPPPQSDTETPPRLVEFTGARPLGTCAVRPADADFAAPWLDAGPAQGVITVPPGHDLLLALPSDATRADLDRLATLDPNALQAIYLNGAAADDDWLQPLFAQRGLRILGLRSTAITDAGLATLNRFPNLERLILSETQITDAGLPVFPYFKNLRDLDLSRTAITDAGLQSLVPPTRFPPLPHLETLRLPPATTDAGIAPLMGLSTLTHLDAMDTQITDAGLQSIARLHRLQRLNLSRTPITSAGLAHLAPLADLRDLLLRETVVDDAALEHLTDLPKLERVFIGATAITPEAAAAFRAAHPTARPVR